MAKSLIEKAKKKADKSADKLAELLRSQAATADLTEDEQRLLLVPVMKLTKDAVAAMVAGQTGTPQLSAGIAGQANATEARVLVDLYYSMQEFRKSIANQIGSMDRGADAGAQHIAATFMASQVDAMESNAKAWLEAFAQTHGMWPWFKAVHGIGPVLSAGLIAHLGGRPVPPTVGHWWRYAGLDPSQQWLKADELAKRWAEAEGDIDQRIRTLSAIVGRDPATVIRDATVDFRTGETKELTRAGALKSLARIPFNRPLKTLAWKCTDQWVKLGANENAYYAVYYRNRKAQEVARNARGDRAELARKTLEAKPTHAQRAIYADGLLPDGRLDLMARRATVKLFLSHLHELWYRLENDGRLPPKPFSISMQGHGHYLEPPHMDALGMG
jgi:hypothetical protein